MDTWQILILNMVVFLGPHPQPPKPLTALQLQQFAAAFKAGDFKIPAAAP